MKTNVVLLCPYDRFGEHTALRLAKKAELRYADIFRFVEQETGCTSEEILQKAGKRYLTKRRNETLRAFAEFEGVLFLLPEGELRTKTNLRYLSKNCFRVALFETEQTEPSECDAAVTVCGKTPAVVATEINRLWKKYKEGKQTKPMTAIGR